MTTPTGSRNMRQFSLRTLLLLVLASAVLLGAWRALGTAAMLGLLFATLSAIPLATLNGPWKRAYLVSWSALYGPFLAMAAYVLLYVSCSHCQATAWTLLPSAPGLIPVEVARRAFDLPRSSDTVWFAVSLLVSALMVTLLSWQIRRRSRWWRALSVGAALALCSCGAVAILALIRA
jgi:hypothetical protein